jgi:hypothetical protein
MSDNPPNKSAAAESDYINAETARLRKEPGSKPAHWQGDSIALAAKVAQPLFRLKQWTWRREPTPPSLLDLEAVYSSLVWDLQKRYGFDGDGQTHYAGTGRLLVIMQGNGDCLLTVQTGKVRA